MAFTDQEISAVWAKGKIVSNNEQNVWRKDECDAWIKRSEHGNRNSTYGWEIDHIKPKDQGGSDNLSNLRPLQWENNAAKSSGRLVCVVTSSGTNNVKK